MRTITARNNSGELVEFTLPEFITRQQRDDALASLGIPVHGTSVTSVTFGLYGIEVERVARNENGEPIVNNEGEVAREVHTIPLGRPGATDDSPGHEG